MHEGHDEKNGIDSDPQFVSWVTDSRQGEGSSSPVWDETEVFEELLEGMLRHCSLLSSERRRSVFVSGGAEQLWTWV